jgi:iron complex outermembrane receptor protein
VKRSALRPPSLLALCVALACAGVPAYAATPGDAAPPKRLQTIVVTGTHIRGADLESEHPLLVLKRDDLLRTGVSGVADILQSLVIANGQTLNRNINNGGSGELRVNLRSLGANRTLVLVNGHRWVSAVDGAVDLSAIPLALVQRVEVLKDGASAIYGSDAIGGVINIITRQDFRGAETGVYAGQSDHGDGFGRQVDFSIGGGGDRWNAAFGLTHGKDDPVMADSRTISSVPAPGLPLGATGSPSSQYGLFGRPGYGMYVLIPGRPGTSADDFRKFDPATDSAYDYVPYNYLQTPQERRAAFGQLRFELSPMLALSADALFNRRQSAQRLAPPVVGFSPAVFSGETGQQSFGVSPFNAYNPFGSPVGVFTRWPDDKPRRFEQMVDTTRFHVGVDGAFTVLAQDWQWGIDATRTESRQREFVGPYADNQRLRLAVGPSYFDAGGTARCGTPGNIIEGCVPLDLFTGPGRFTQAMLDYVDIDVVNHKHGRSDALDAHATGTLAELAAGSLGFAAGVTRRLERGSDDPDPLVASNRANGTGVTSGPTDGAYAVNEAYAELDIPLIAQRPLVRELDLNVATRYSRYSQFGGTDNSRVGLRWKPTGGLLFRATWSQGFRGPSISEAYGGSVFEPADVFDVCATQNHYTPPPRIAAHCLADGVPAGVSSDFVATETVGSNRDLKPETSRSLTAGFVYSPAWAPGLDASVDGYRIRIRNAIGNLGSQAVLGGCYRDGDPVACSRIVRNPDGTLAHIDAINQNLPGGIETQGVDLGLSWRHPTRAGDFALSWQAAYVDYWGAIGRPARGAILPDGSLAAGNRAGKIDGAAVWRWRSVATLAWRRGAWGASVTGRYFSPLVEGCETVYAIAEEVDDASLLALCSDPGHVENGSPVPRNRVGAVTFVDLEASWHAPWKGVFTLGVRNALDRDPPLSRAYTGFNSFLPDYDIPGRYFHMAYRQKF